MGALEARVKADRPRPRLLPPLGALIRKGGWYGWKPLWISNFSIMFLCVFILVLKWDKQFLVEQFEATVSQSTVPSPPLLLMGVVRRDTGVCRRKAPLSCGPLPCNPSAETPHHPPALVFFKLVFPHVLVPGIVFKRSQGLGSFFQIELFKTGRKRERPHGFVVIPSYYTYTC